eukprot:jgi/Hompol1/3122/HPOL_003125-RA
MLADSYLGRFLYCETTLRPTTLSVRIMLLAVNIMDTDTSYRDISELWATADTIEQLFDEIRAGEQWKRLIPTAIFFAGVVCRLLSTQPQYMTCSWKFNVEIVGTSLTMPEQLQRIERFAWLGYDGPIDLKNPDTIFMYYEDYGFNGSLGLPIPEKPLKTFFGIWLARGNRALIAQYDLKKRGYLGTTSMDAELSLVMANQALARPGTLILDPFVGTGSFLVSCSHFGAYTLGSDIDGRQIRGTSEKNVDSNVKQYKLESRVLDSIICDIANHSWRDGEWWDAIVCDPPYGVRAGAKRIASNPDTKPTFSAIKANGEPRYPQTIVYEMEDVIVDLVSFAASHLVPGGRLVFWLPTMNEQYEPQDIPTHSRLVLIANSEQSFGKWSRRLITMEKIAPSEADQAAADAKRAAATNAGLKEAGHANFREKYFEPKK